MRKILFAMALIVGWFANNGIAVAAEKDDVFERGCGDDDGNDRCAADTQKKMRASYGIEDAKTLMESGVTLRRAMIVDGYGNDIIAVTFARKPGSSPAVEIRSPCFGKKDCPDPMTASVTPQIWERVLNQSENFDQKLAREIPVKERGKDEPITLCLHGWVVVVEAADAAQLEQNVLPAGKRPGELRSDTEGGCADGLALAYAFELVELARQSLPECGTLKSEWFRNSSMLLSNCAYLKGDRHAAGQAYALLEKLPRRIGDDEDSIKDAFAWDKKELVEQFKKAWGDGVLYLDAPEAIDQDNATVKGTLVFDNDETKKAEGSEVTLTLVRESDYFEIAAFEIGERKPMPELD